LGGALRRFWAGDPLSPRMHLALGLIAPMALTIANAIRVRAFTVDDAFITFRYADNFGSGHGLVYNVGERVEGYTNFLWTVLLGVLSRLGAAPEPTSKVLGAICAAAALVPLYRLAHRLAPLQNIPCLATWLCASSFVYTGYAVFGMEAPLFALLALGGAERFVAEQDAEIRGAPPRVPWSGVLFALASLTRPEAPLLFLLLVASSGKRALSRAGLIRLASFAAPVLLHLLWRRGYYGAWLPNTFGAKTGDLREQLKGGADYLEKYAAHAGAILWLAIGAVGIALARLTSARPLALLGLALSAWVVLFGVYVVLVGGDWMPYFRFIAPAEPFAFLLVDQVLRTILERRERVATVALAAFGAWTVYSRVDTLRDGQRHIVKNDKTFWDDSAGRTAEWFLKNGQPGPIGIADIGYVGYRTGYPIVDMLGLLAPEIARLPGGYTRKVGAGYTDAIFARQPRYFVIINAERDCKSPTVPSSRAVFADARFADYRLRETIRLKGGGAWCIFAR
jgi:hypothetical protein